MTPRALGRLATSVAGALLAAGLLGACSGGDDVPQLPGPSTSTSPSGSPSGGVTGPSAPGSSPVPSTTTRPSTAAPTTAAPPGGTPTAGRSTVPAPSSGLPVPVPTGAAPEN